MITDDALMILATAFDLQRVGLDAEGRPEQDFARDEIFFVATEFGPSKLRLAAPIPGLSLSAQGLTRLLEGNCLSHESGPAQLAWNPIGDGAALVAFIDLTRLDTELFQERVTDFLIYAHYWQLEGPALTVGGDTQPMAADTPEMTMIRV
jgi:hypothetical protein